MKKISLNGNSPITVIPKDEYTEGVISILKWEKYSSNDEILNDWYFDDLKVGDIGRYAKYHDFVKIIAIYPDKPSPLYGHLIAVQSSWEEANEYLKNKKMEE